MIDYLKVLYSDLFNKKKKVRANSIYLDISHFDKKKSNTAKPIENKKVKTWKDNIEKDEFNNFSYFYDLDLENQTKEIIELKKRGYNTEKIYNIVSEYNSEILKKEKEAIKDFKLKLKIEQDKRLEESIKLFLKKRENGQK